MGLVGMFNPYDTAALAQPQQSGQHKYKDILGFHIFLWFRKTIGARRSAFSRRTFRYSKNNQNPESWETPEKIPIFGKRRPGPPLEAFPKTHTTL